MLDRKVIGLRDGLIQSRYAERCQRLAADFLAVDQQCNACRMFHSGDHVRRVVEICRREICM